MKITRTTIKKFIRENKDLYIKHRTKFDGMVDGVTDCQDKAFHPVKRLEPTHHNFDYSLGIEGAYFVGGSRNWFDAYEKDGMKGYEVSNCCGSFILAAKI